jgi:hypothetical protein
MKVQAIKEAPERTWQDLADIGFLLRLPGVDRARLRATSSERACWRGGMSSFAHSDEGRLDLERDVRTTPADVAALRRLRDQAPSWFSLSTSELLAMMPPGALDRRLPMQRDARPFTLDDPVARQRLAELR